LSLAITRLSQLCGGGFPGQADGADFFGCGLVGARWLKFGGDEDAAELGGHVGGGRRGFRLVPGCAAAAVVEVGGVVAGGGVPGHGDGLAGELEWDGAADRVSGAVAGLAGAEFLPGVFYRDLSSSPA
jgi:hypothetical protein